MNLQPNLLVNLSCQVIKDVETSYLKHKTLTKDSLEALHSLYGNVLMQAAECLENNKIVKYQSENGLRVVFKIGHGVDTYLIRQSINWCNCLNFQHQVLEQKEHLTCKHVLAVTLSNIIGNYKTESVNDAEFSDLLKQPMDDN